MRAVCRKVPVSAYGKASVLLFGHVCGRKLLDVQKRGRRIGYISELHVLPEALAIGLREFGCYGEDGLNFGTKQQPLTVESIMQWLLPQAIARDQHLMAALVIQCERKHAPQLMNAIPAHFLIEMDNHFGIAVG